MEPSLFSIRFVNLSIAQSPWIGNPNPCDSAESPSLPHCVILSEPKNTCSVQLRPLAYALGQAQGKLGGTGTRGFDRPRPP